MTYGASSFILLRFSRYVLNRMSELVKQLEDMKLNLDKNKQSLESLEGFSQIYRIVDYTLNAIGKYGYYREIIDKILES